MLLSLQTPAERPQNIVVELDDGTELPIEKIYYIGGKSKVFKVLTSDPLKKKRESELEDLKHDYEILKQEEKDTQKEVEKWERECLDSDEKHEKELNEIENAIEDLELQLGIQTSARSIKGRIEELTEKIAVKFNRM